MSYNSIVEKKSFKFAANVINIYKYLCKDKREFVLSKQLLRAGTGIGANIREGINAQSKKDFLSKMNIALKETNETLYWLELLKETNYFEDTHNYLIEDCKEIFKILNSIVKTTKQNI